MSGLTFVESMSEGWLYPLEINYLLRWPGTLICMSLPASIGFTWQLRFPRAMRGHWCLRVFACVLSVILSMAKANPMARLWHKKTVKYSFLSGKKNNTKVCSEEEEELVAIYHREYEKEIKTKKWGYHVVCRDHQTLVCDLPVFCILLHNWKTD